MMVPVRAAATGDAATSAMGESERNRRSRPARGHRTREGYDEWGSGGVPEERRTR